MTQQNQRIAMLGMRDHVIALYKDDQREAHRAGGDVVCQHCGFKYYEHPLDGEPDSNGDKYLHRLCDGRLVKL